MQRPATVKLRGTVEGVAYLRSRPSGKAPTVVLGRRTVFRTGMFSGEGGGGNISFEAPIHTDGTFEFPEVPAGMYMVRTIPTTPGPWASIEVKDRDIEDLKITIPPQGEISGRVTVDNADAMPTTGKIQFASRSTNVGYYTAIHPDGSFRTTLPFGEYTVSAMDLPLSFALQATEVLKVDAADKEILVPLTTVRLESIPGVTVRGRTTRPVRDTDVRLLAPDAGRPRSVQLQPDGTFEFLKVLPGKYSVMLGRLPVLVQAAVTVGDEDVTGIVLAVPPLFEVSGEIEVVDSVGKSLEIPPPPLCVLFQNSEHGRMAIGLKGGRTFTLRLGEGEYEVLVQDFPWDYSVKSIGVGSIDLTRSRMKLADGMTPPKAIRVVLECVPVSK